MYEDIPIPNFGLNFDPSNFIWQHMDYLKRLNSAAGSFTCNPKTRAWIMTGWTTWASWPTERFSHSETARHGGRRLREIFSVLSETGYDGAVCVEVEDRAYEGSLENRKASLTHSTRYLRQCIP